MRHSIAFWLLVAIPAAACSKDQQARLAQLADSIGRSASSGSAQSSSDGSAGNDPCTLVSRAEAERLMGPLRHDPYRTVSSSSREPDPKGSACIYEAQTGRRVILEPTWTDGQMAMRVVAMGGRLVEQVIPTDTGQADTLEGRWDELRMLPGDNLYARQGDAMVQVDYLGSGIGLPGAAKFAHLALGRIHHALAYDGAAAARTAPGPLVPPRDPCTLVDRADVEAIIGRLAGDPVSDAHQTTCTYTLAQSRGLGGREVALQVQWKDGWAALEGARQTMQTVASQVAPPGAMAHGSSAGPPQSGSAPPPAAGDTQLGKFMNGVMGAMRSQGIGVQLAGTPGGLKSDTAVAGPWDAGELQMGLGLTVVKHDAMLGLDLRTITYEQAKALLTKAVARIP